ncbi:hypothetical protein CSC36_6095, partial [Pseudomonas aeruginosa]
MTLLRAVTGLGHAAAGIIPESMSIEFQEASKGSAEPFMAMMRWCDDSMSKAILGGTLTSQPASRAVVPMPWGRSITRCAMTYWLRMPPARRHAEPRLLWPSWSSTAPATSTHAAPPLVFDLKDRADLAPWQRH